MKTGFLYGDARAPKFVYYYYHGKIMQCRKEPWIPPYIYYDTNPAEYPPNYYYACDTMPDGTTPPMTFGSASCTDQSIGGGFFHARTKGVCGSNATFLAYYWNITPTAKLEITASFPILEFTGGVAGTMTAAIYLNSATQIGVRSFRTFNVSDHQSYLTSERTLIKKDWRTYFERPFTNYMHIVFEKIPATNRWNFYFNDEWIFDISYPQVDRTSFVFIGSAKTGGHGALDYIRAWKDKERF